MSFYNLQNLLQEYRKRKHISQEKLCEGICSLSAYSRIERGEQIPERKTLEAIISRIGLPILFCNIPTTDTEKKRADIQMMISRKIACNDFEIMDLLQKFKSSGPELKSLEKQYYLRMKALYGKYHNTDPEEVLNMYIDALRITVPEYTVGMNLRGMLLSEDEILILNNISRQLYDSGKKDDAIAVMEYLYEYIKSEYPSEACKAADTPVIVYNLIGWKELKEEYKDALRLAEEGIQICKKYNNLVYFSYFTFNKGYSLAGLGRKEEGRKQILFSFSLFKQMNDNQSLKECQKIVNEKFGFSFKEY